MCVCVGVSVCVCFKPAEYKRPGSKIMPRDNKRQRKQTAATAKTSLAPSKPQTPIGVATMAIDTYMESLNKEVRPTLSRKAKTYLHEVATTWGKLEVHAKLTADESLIPRSARINFTIKSNKATTVTEEYHTLIEETDKLVTETKKKFHASIMKSIALKIGQQIDNVAKLLLSGFNLCVQIATIETNESPDGELDATRKIAIALFPAVDETTAISVTKLTGALEKLYPLPATQQSNAGEPVACPEPVVTRARELAAALFILPLRKWHEARKAQKLQEKLRAVAIAETNQATEDASMEVDIEPSIDKAKVKDLIKEAVSKKTAALKRELEKLRCTRRSGSPYPKAKRGQRQGASSKEKKSKNNKSNKKTNKKTTQSNSNNDKIDAAANDSNKNGGTVRKLSYPNSQRKSRNNKSNGKHTNSRSCQRN